MSKVGVYGKSIQAEVTAKAEALRNMEPMGKGKRSWGEAPEERAPGKAGQV